MTFRCGLNITNVFQWRLLLAGLYPVEFRDFLLGDMYCSLTFLMSVSITIVLGMIRAN
jgi:hypothetical protein